MVMALSKSPRLIVLAAMAGFALLLGSLLAATLLAPAASASEVSVSNLVIRSVTIDPQTKVATARGVVTCTGGRRVTLYVEVYQTVGRLNTVVAAGQKTIACDGRRSFSIQLSNYQGRLGPGDATVNAYAEAFTATDYDFAEFSKVLPVTNTNA